MIKMNLKLVNFLSLGLLLILIGKLNCSAQETLRRDSFYSYVKTMPAFPGGESAMWKFINKNMIYPQIAINDKAEGKVMLALLIDTAGVIVNASVYKSIHPSLDSEAMRLVGLMPVWTPGFEKGKKINVRYFLPVSFKLGNYDSSTRMQSQEFPGYSYPGGAMGFIRDNIVYPRDAKRNDIEGTVMVKFVIEEDGTVIDPVVAAPLYPSLDREALRVIKLMKWIPAKINGKPAKTNFTYPVFFRLID